jgi:hypothetical protein
MFSETAAQNYLSHTLESTDNILRKRRVEIAQ